MKKITILWIVSNLIILAIFNLIFFVLSSTEYNNIMWMSYGFIHFAYLMLLLTPLLIRKGKSEAVFGFSTYVVSTVYFIIALIAGLTFILLFMDEFNVALTVQLCIVGSYGVILIANLIANERTADAEEKRQPQIVYVKDASAKLKSLLENISGRDAKKSVERVYDAINSSQIRSHPNLSQLENRIIQDIDDLGYAVSLGDEEKIISKANVLLSSVNSRNMQLKMLN